MLCYLEFHLTAGNFTFRWFKYIRRRNTNGDISRTQSTVLPYFRAHRTLQCSSNSNSSSTRRRSFSRNVLRVYLPVLSTKEKAKGPSSDTALTVFQRLLAVSCKRNPRCYIFSYSKAPTFVK